MILGVLQRLIDYMINIFLCVACSEHAIPIPAVMIN